MAGRLNTSAVLAKTLLLFFVLIMVAIFLMKPPFTSSTAPVQEERVVENTIPNDVPIKLKIKKEKERSFKDVKNEKWAREFELELTNTGDKPIFYLDILMVTDVKAVDGHRIVFPLQYGRVGLADIISKPGPQDIPIQPGETHIFKIHPGQVPAWEQGQREENRPQPKRMRLELQLLSFGDGTGYFGNQPYPPVEKKQSAFEDPREPPNKDGPRFWGLPTGERGTEPEALSIIDLPVTSLPANFLYTDSSQSPNAPNQSCGLFDYCVGIIPWAGNVCYNCPNQNRPTFYSGGVCKELVYDKIDCFIDGEKYFCQTIRFTTAVLDRDRLQCPLQRQHPHRVVTAHKTNQTQPLLVPRTAPIHLSQLAHLIRFKDLGVVMQ